MTSPASLPDPTPSPGLPSRVTIVEVGARDGLQNEKSPIATADKLRFVHALADAGLPVVEATSFVDPRWVPQLADAAELFPAIEQRPGVRYPVLVPNERGLDGALAAGVQEISVFASATETFAQRNLASGLDDQFTMFTPVVRRARSAGLRVRGYLSMCFGDPWEGRVPRSQVIAAATRLVELGCQEISLGDTIGVGTAGQVEALIADLVGAGIGVELLAVHFHDTYGQALANTLAALRAGVTVVDASAGGLGGCPYAKSATGNLATEDLVWMLDGLGIAHGVDLGALVRASTWMAALLGRPSPSAVVRALTSPPD